MEDKKTYEAFAIIHSIRMEGAINERALSGVLSSGHSIEDGYTATYDDTWVRVTGALRFKGLNLGK